LGALTPAWASKPGEATAPHRRALRRAPLPPARMTFQIHGKGKPETVVLIHGVGDRSHTWHNLVEQFSQRYQVVTYDLRGHGKTPALGDDYTSGQHAEDLKGLLDSLGLGKVHLIGHSAGGRTAVKFAERYPERVGSVVVEDMHFKGLGSEAKRADEVLARADEIRAKLPPALEFESADAARAALADYFKPEKIDSILKHVATVDGKVTLAQSPEVEQLYYNQAISEDHSEALRNVRSRMLFFKGDETLPESKVVLFGKGVEHLKELRPTDDIVTVPVGTHKLHDHPVFLEKTLAFLEHNRIVGSEAARKATIEEAKKLDIPAFMRWGMPVMLLNNETLPKLQPLLDRSLGVAVRLHPLDPNSTDHGMRRFGRVLTDMDMPGERGFGELWSTGLAWKWMSSYLTRRGHNSERIVELVYELSPAEKNVEEYYQRVRRASVFRAPYTFAFGSDVVHRHPHAVWGGDENCFTFGVGKENGYHVNNMKELLWKLGVADVPALLAHPKVRTFQQNAMKQILAVSLDRPEFMNATTPEAEQAVLNIGIFKTAENMELLKDVMPSGLDEAKQIAFLNYLVGIDASLRQMELMHSLGVDSNFFHMNRPRASAILIYDTNDQADRFRRNDYWVEGNRLKFNNADGSFSALPK
jgi:pimeloyl-ACP methyl ester carboxylesterase